MADAYIPIGPGFLLIGDPTQAGGAGMTNLGLCEAAVLDMGSARGFVSDARTNGRAKSDGVYQLDPDPTLQCSLYDADLDLVIKAVTGLAKTTSGSDEAVGFGGGGPTKLTLNTAVFVPFFQKGDGVGAKNAIWIPAAYDEGGLSGLTHNRMDEGESNRTFDLTLRGARRTTDQGSTAIPDDAQYAFMGVPAALSLTWYLPTIS